MKERLNRILRHPLTIPVVAVTVSGGIAYSVGYYVGRRKITIIQNFDQDPQMTLDLDNLTPLFEEKKLLSPPQGKVHNKPEEVFVEKDEKIVADGADFVAKKMEKTVVIEPAPEEEEEAPVPRNVFARDTEEWNYEEEIKNRTRNSPYVIHKDEFYAEEKRDEGYTQQTLIYYEGDDIMSDQEDKPVYNHAGVVGELKFGHGSEDPNVFHVRNERLKAEYEIIYDPGLYSKEVLGLEIENNQRVKNLKHSEPPKFRDE